MELFKLFNLLPRSWEIWCLLSSINFI